MLDEIQIVLIFLNSRKGNARTPFRQALSTGLIGTAAILITHYASIKGTCGSQKGSKYGCSYTFQSHKGISTKKQ